MSMQNGHVAKDYLTIRRTYAGQCVCYLLKVDLADRRAQRISYGFYP